VKQAIARDLGWDGCVNVRDLGGHATEDGAETRSGRVVRADSVRQLSEAGWTALVAYGVRTIVDLRFHSELEADPPAELPVDTVHVPLFPDPASHHWPEIDALSAAAGPGAPGMTVFYAELLRRFPERFAEAVAAVAEAPAGGVVVHCMVGKDRTGLVSALLLRLAGVPLATIGADYAATAANLRQQNLEWIAAAASDAERAWRQRISASPPEAMVSVLTQLARRHGDVAGYLRLGGATSGQLAAARARLR
jgi:protein-tyrosine phosphatase